MGWKAELLDFRIPKVLSDASYEAALDSTAGFVRCSNACAHYQRVAAEKGVKFRFGLEVGAVESWVKIKGDVPNGKYEVVGLKKRDGSIHNADIGIVAGESMCQY